MRRGRRPRAIALAAAALTLGLAPGCGTDEEDGPSPAPEDAVERPAAPGSPQPPQPGRERDEDADAPGADERETASGPGRAERIGERVYGAYVEAINARDGERLCSLLAPGSLAELRPPVERGGCARSLTASIGHRDPRGFPVWESTTLSAIESVERGEGWIRVTASIVTEFADREQPSLESDLAYIEPGGAGGWRLVRASAALHRAVGKPDVHPGVIAPPR